MSFKVLAESKSSHFSGVFSDDSHSILWFKSSSLKAIGPFALQLETKSPDATKSGHPDFRFDIAVFANSHEATPIKTCFSHYNESLSSKDVWHYGPIFYPDHSLVKSIEIGHVIGVNIRSPQAHGKRSLDVEGRLVVKPLAGMLPLTHHNLTWSLRDSANEGDYTFATQENYSLKSPGNESFGGVWFKSAPLTDDVLSRLSNVRLCTSSHHKGSLDDTHRGIWPWFEITVFPDEDEKKHPVTFKGKPLSVTSHRIAANENTNRRQHGKSFTREDDIISHLKAGNVLVVRVCAEHGGWHNHVRSGRLLIKLSERKEAR